MHPFPRLFTGRLLLQPLEPEDQGFVFQGLSHPDVIAFYGVNYSSFDNTKAQMDWYEKMHKERSGLSWKLVERSSGGPCGVVSVYYFKPEHRKAELGFWLLPEHWGKGYVSEALKPVIDFWKTKMHLHRMEAFVEEGNIASARLLEKNGFRLEGIMRDCEIKNGRFISLMVYALLAGR